MDLVAMLIGAVLLLFGRRLFWFFVGAAGFAAGLILARDTLHLQSDALVLVIAIFAGILGAVLSIFLQKLAIGLAGLAAGGYLGAIVTSAFQAGQYAWIGFLVGGILGALLLLTLFDWALIGISALLGAALIAEGFADRATSLAVFLGALFVGLIVQSLQLKRARRGGEPPPPRRVRDR